MSIFIWQEKTVLSEAVTSTIKTWALQRCTYALAVLFQSICHILDIVVANLKIEIDIKIFVLTTIFPAMHCPLHLERNKTTSENCADQIYRSLVVRMSNMRGIPSLRISKLSNTRLKAQPRNINFR